MSTTTAAADGTAMTEQELDELLARIAAMSVSELAALSPAEVYAWPGDPKATGDVSRNPRALRRRKMLASRNRVRLDDVADMAGVGRDAVAKWRGENIKAPGKATTRAMPDPIPLDEAQVARLRAREARTGRPSRPSREWYDGLMWGWLDDTDRLDKSGDLFPKPGRGGRSPSGRTPAPKQRTGK